MDVVCTPGAGFDVHQKTGMAGRVIPDPTGQPADGLMERQEFGTLTVDLRALSDWWAARGLAQRMRDGVLQARVIPPVEQRDWRDLTRDRRFCRKFRF